MFGLFPKTRIVLDAIYRDPDDEYLDAAALEHMIR